MRMCKTRQRYRGVNKASDGSVQLKGGGVVWRAGGLAEQQDVFH